MERSLCGGFRQTYGDGEFLAMVDRSHPPGGPERTGSGLREAIDGREDIWICEYRFLRADGTWADIYDRAYIARDGAWNFTSFESVNA